MKQLIRIVMATSILLLILSGCSGSQDSNSDDGQGSSQDTSSENTDSSDDMNDEDEDTYEGDEGDVDEDDLDISVEDLAELQDAAEALINYEASGFDFDYFLTPLSDAYESFNNALESAPEYEEYFFALNGHVLNIATMQMNISNPQMSYIMTMRSDDWSDYESEWPNGSGKTISTFESKADQYHYYYYDEYFESPNTSSTDTTLYTDSGNLDIEFIDNLMEGELSRITRFQVIPYEEGYLLQYHEIIFTDNREDLTVIVFDNNDHFEYYTSTKEGASPDSTFAYDLIEDGPQEPAALLSNMDLVQSIIQNGSEITFENLEAISFDY